MANHDYAGDWQARYTAFLNDGFKRMGFASTEARARQYSAEKLISDTYTSWMDLASLWLFPVEVALKLITIQAFVLTIPVHQTDATGFGATAIPDVGTATFDAAELKLESDPNYKIAATSVNPAVVDQGNVLVVQLSNLQNLHIGTYVGDLRRHDGQPPVVRLRVEVTR